MKSVDLAEFMRDYIVYFTVGYMYDVVVKKVHVRYLIS